MILIVNVGTIGADALEAVLKCGHRGGDNVWIDTEAECFKTLPALSPHHVVQTAEKTESSPIIQRRLPGGVGTELAKLIKMQGISDEGCPICNQLRDTWDGWGIDECERRADEIEARLLERAKDRGFFFGTAVMVNESLGGIAGKPTAKALVAQAIINARSAMSG